MDRFYLKESMKGGNTVTNCSKTLVHLNSGSLLSKLQTSKVKPTETFMK